jgi:hypothetical protein
MSWRDGGGGVRRGEERRGEMQGEGEVDEGEKARERADIKE